MEHDVVPTDHLYPLHSYVCLLCALAIVESDLAVFRYYPALSHVLWETQKTQMQSGNGGWIEVMPWSKMEGFIRSFVANSKVLKKSGREFDDAAVDMFKYVMFGKRDAYDDEEEISKEEFDQFWSYFSALMPFINKIYPLWASLPRCGGSGVELLAH